MERSEYLSLPLTLEEGHFPRCNLRDSLVNSVRLIISTRVGQLPFLPEFGCMLWEREFTDLHTASKADVRASIRTAIGVHEPRLYNVDVVFSEGDVGKHRQIGLIVKVTATYREGGVEKMLDVSCIVE